MQIADKYYLNYLAKFIADNLYYRDNFKKIIDYLDKKYCRDGNPSRFQSEISPVAKDVNLVLSLDSLKSTVSLNQVNNLPNISKFFLIDDLVRSEWMAALVDPPRFDELANASPKYRFIKATHSL